MHVLLYDQTCAATVCVCCVVLIEFVCMDGKVLGRVWRVWGERSRSVNASCVWLVKRGEGGGVFVG